MEKRTLILFAAMLTLFAFYATVSFKTTPAMASGLKAQTELLNSMDQEVKSPAELD